jgi:hypothetical protein
VIGDAQRVQPKRQDGEILRDIKIMAKTISAKNWREKKAAMLKMLATVG